MANTGNASTPAYSRDDLDELKTFDRVRILDTFGSFEDRGLSDDAFSLRMADLLDPGAIPGLAEAVETGDAAGIRNAVYRACMPEAPAESTPSATDERLRQADDILAHRFTFYDETHQLPPEIDWDHNPGTAHWSHDLNRFSFLVPLTDAYLATRDTRYSRKAIDLILDWISKCDIGQAFVGTPYMFGSYLNNALHCEGWAARLLSLLPYDQVQPGELLRILKSLYDQMAYLAIVTNGHAGNWPIIGCRGILAVLASFPVFRDTQMYADYALRTLSSQLDDQILPDGVQDELTPHYHWTVVHRLIGGVGYARQLGLDFAPRTVELLRRMVHYLQQTIVPDGSTQVAFNDSDPAAAPDIAGHLAAAGLSEFSSPPEALGPELFPYAGVAFLRQRPAAGDLYLAFDGGPFGRGHQHEDKLGFWLFAYGRNFLVDPGRHLYDWSEASYYDYLKSTHAHSLILIDHQGQHSRGRPDTWIPEAPVPMTWSVAKDEIRAGACYDLGYGEDNRITVTHHREIVFIRERFWIVFDRLEGEGTHHVESRFQFAPCDLQINGTQAHTCFDDANLLLWTEPSAPYTDIHVDCGSESPRGGWYSKRYALLEPAPALSLSLTTALPFTAATLLYPYRGSDKPKIAFHSDGDGVVVTGEETDEVYVRVHREI